MKWTNQEEPPTLNRPEIKIWYKSIPPSAWGLYVREGEREFLTDKALRWGREGEGRRHFLRSNPIFSFRFLMASSLPIVYLVVVVLLVHGAHGFYLPGVSPQDFQKVSSIFSLHVSGLLVFGSVWIIRDLAFSVWFLRKCEDDERAALLVEFCVSVLFWRVWTGKHGSIELMFEFVLSWTALNTVISFLALMVLFRLVFCNIGCDVRFRNIIENRDVDWNLPISKKCGVFFSFFSQLSRIIYA